MRRDIGTLVVDMLLFCPRCGAQHIDAPAPCSAENCADGCASPGLGDCLAWSNPPHRSHLCHECRHIWRPSDIHTNGVASIASRGVNDSEPKRPMIWTGSDWERPK